MSDRVALYLQDDHPLRDAIKYVRYAETRNFEAVWQAETRLGRDATIAAATYAAITNRIKIGTAVINTWSRNASTIAAIFATLDDIAPDRIIAGLGPWHDPLATQTGIIRSKPLLQMREVIQTARSLLAGQPVNFYGEFVNFQNLRLDNVTLDEPRHVPIYIGATSTSMMALSGEIADGVLLNYLVSPDYTTNAVVQIEIGARKAGRALESIDRPQLIMCAVDNDRVKALDQARRIVTQYLRQNPQIMKASGVHQELLDDINQVLPWPHTEQQLQDAMRLVPDEIVQLVTASGTPEECKAKIREYMYAGATCPVLYPIGTDVNFLIDTFAFGYTN